MNAFAYFDGVPHEILFDYMKTVVGHSRSTFTKTEINTTFKAFAVDAGFKPITCRPYRSRTKGKVEALAKFMNRLKVYNNEFDTYMDFFEIVEKFCDEINNEISQATNGIPFERSKREKEYLYQCLTWIVFVPIYATLKHIKFIKTP